MISNPNELYDYADNHCIDIEIIKTRMVESMSVMDNDGDCFVGINPLMIESTADETVKLAHELGHCETGSFYYGYSPLQLRCQCEHKADVWAIKKLISKDELIEAFKCGIVEKWELAEYFNVTEEFIVKTLVYYNFISI